MQTYNTFYHTQGVRTSAHLKKPPLGSIVDFSLPKNSTYLYYDPEELAVGPEMKDPLITHYEGRVMVVHQPALATEYGPARPASGINEDRLKQDYHRRFRKLRRARDFETAARNPESLVVYSIGAAQQLVQYRRQRLSEYYKWYNTLYTVVANAQSKMKDNPDRQWYVRMDLPKVLPSIQTLRKASVSIEEVKAEFAEAFEDPSSMWVLEIWKLLTGGAKYSIFHEYAFSDFERLNLVLVESGHTVTLNLQTLLSFSVDSEEAYQGLEDAKLGRQFLKMLIQLINLRENGEMSEADDEDDEEALDRQIQTLETMEQDRVVSEEVVPKDPEEALQKKVDQLAAQGRLSPKQYERYQQLREKTKSIPNPFGEGTLQDAREIDPEALTLSDEDRKLHHAKGVTDESMFESSLQSLDRKYITQVMDKDITNSVTQLQKAGVNILDFQVEEVEDAANHYQTMKIQVQPVGGEISTLRFRVPKVQEDGTFFSNNVKYRLRRQRNDLPIRKVSESSVALTSYYAKLFVDRSEKKAVDYGAWLGKTIVTKGLDKEDESVTDFKHMDTFTTRINVPRVYSILAHRCRSLTLQGKYRLYVDYNRREEAYGEDYVHSVESDEYVFAGEVEGDPIVVDWDNNFYRVTEQGSEELGRIEDLLEIDRQNAPIEIAEFRLFSRNVPVGVALGYYYGLSNLVQRLGAKSRRVKAGSQLNLQEDEYTLRFSDETLILSREDRVASLVLAGFNRFHRSLRNYAIDTFDHQDVYGNIMEENGLRVGFMRELDLAMDLFVDPITEEILESMEEPTALDQLLIRSCELLLTDYHREETDMSEMRFRGYERMAGAIYEELVKSVRAQRARGVGQAPKIEMNPEAVWQKIHRDPAVAQMEESNPVHNLKEKEIVTYVGAGGRSKQSMVKRTRAFHDSDMGVTSEATVDSGDVGINAYLSANPQITDLRGRTAQYDPETTGASSMVSTSAMLAPSIEHDDQ
mgnify:CR=1 FL=1